MKRFLLSMLFVLVCAGLSYAWTATKFVNNCGPYYIEIGQPLYIISTFLQPADTMTTACYTHIRPPQTVGAACTTNLDDNIGVGQYCNGGLVANFPRFYSGSYNCLDTAHEGQGHMDFTITQNPNGSVTTSAHGVCEYEYP